MKAKKLLSFVALSLLATGCGNTSESTPDTATPSTPATDTAAPSTDSEVPATDTATSDAESASESESASEEPVVKTLDLSALKTGYDAKITLKEESSSTTLDAYEIKVSDGVLIYDDYYSSNESKQGWDDEAIALKSRVQYESHDFSDEDKGAFTRVTTDLATNPVYTKQPLIDSLTEENEDVTFEDAFMVNCFQFLTADDFDKNEDGTYSLVINDTKKNEETFAKAYYGLNHQFAPIINASYDGSKAKFKYDALGITEFVLTVDDNLVPTSFSMKLGEENKWGSIYKRTLTGDFIATGADCATKYAPEETKYTELEEKIKKLQAGNFSFTAHFGIYEDDYYQTNATAVYLSGTFDGSVLSLLGYKEGKELGEYYKFTDNLHYRAFQKSSGKYVYSGNEVDDTDQINSMLPSFAFSSNTFNRVAAEENGSGINVYSFNKPLLYVSDSSIPSKTDTTNTYVYTNCFIGYKNYNYSTPVTDALLVTTTADTISFQFTNAKKERSYSITYYDLGTTKAFDGTIEEPAEA